MGGVRRICAMFAMPCLRCYVKPSHPRYEHAHPAAAFFSPPQGTCVVQSRPPEEEATSVLGQDNVS